MSINQQVADLSAKANGTPHTVIITRVVKERGQATIMVPEGEDPAEVLEKMRENGDDFLAWDSLSISDLSIDIGPETED